MEKLRIGNIGRFLFAAMAVLSVVDVSAARRNYFLAPTFDDDFDLPITRASDYRDEIGTRKYPWNMSFKDWFEAPYAMPMRRYVLEDMGVVPTVVYLGNFASNPVGGRSRGAAMASNVNFDLGVDFGKLTGRKALDGFALGNAWSWRFGNNLSAERVGNNFTTQQVYGNPTMRFQSLFLSYRKTVCDDWTVFFKLGRFAAGDNFATSPIYWLYQNNAFDGNPVGIFKQQRMSAYPSGTWAAYMRVDYKDGQYFKAGVYKISTDEQDSPHQHGLDWSIGGEGVNANFELGWNFNHDGSGKSPASISAGIAADWYNVPYVQSATIATDFSYSLYLQADYMLINLGAPKSDAPRGSYIVRDSDSYRDLRGLIIWGVIEYNPNYDTAEMPLFINGGLLFNAPFESRADDVVCFGAAYGLFSDRLTTYNSGSYELAFELNYKFQVNKFFFLQPNVQYIVHTNGGEYPDALVLGLQFGLNL